jgi:RNA polymerase sigma factor (sigma-70 family)
VEQEIAFQKLIEQNKGILFKVARTYCRSEEDREDLIQEIMIQVWQSLHKYNDQFKISTWLYRISLNVAISFYRKNATRIDNTIALNEQNSLSQQDDAPENEQQLSLLEQCINELKEIDKALMLLYLEDKSHAEIAEIVGMSVSNVGTKISRIKDKLKLRFSQQNSVYNE